MAKKKDCFGSETYVCRTRECPYVTDCVKVVWEKKMRRVLSDRESEGGATPALRKTGSIRVRSKEFLAR